MKRYRLVFSLFICVASCVLLFISAARLFPTPMNQLAFVADLQPHSPIPQGDILLLDVDYGLDVNLTRWSGNDTFPAWSPDGQQLAFYSQRNQRTDLYLMNADGSDLHRLVDSGGAESSAAWSPDGQWIAYASLHSPAIGLYIIRPDGSGGQRLTSFQSVTLVWSPDSQYIAFVANCDGNCDIYVVEVSSGKVRQLTHNGLVDAYPTWSPDSQYIAFISNRSLSFDVHVLALDCDDTAEGGCTAQRLTYNPDADSFPSWSPDGKQIVFSSNRTGNYELYTVEAACYQQPETCEPGIKQITYSTGRDITALWSADSKQLAYWSNYPNRSSDLHIMEVSTGISRFVLRTTFSNGMAAWRPSS